MIYKNIAMISKQKFASYEWSLSSLIFSTRNDTIEIHNEINTTPKLDVIHKCFSTSREFLASYCEEKNEVKIINWKNGDEITRVTPNDKVLSMNLFYDNKILVCLEEQSDGQRYCLYNIENESSNTLCEKYNFYRNLSFSKSGLYLASIAWNIDEIAALKNHLVLFKKIEKGYDPVKIEHEFEHVFAIRFTEEENEIYVVARKKDDDNHKLWKSTLGSDVWELVFSASYDLARPFETCSSSLFQLSKNYAFIVSHENGFSRIKAVDLKNGKLKELERLKKYSFVDDIKIDDSGNLLAFIVSSYKQTPELIIYDIAKDKIRSIAKSSTHKISKEDLSPPELLSWKSSGDDNVRGLFYSSRKEIEAPLVIMVHNGPFSQAYAGWPSKAHFLNELGYHALYINYRGSSGYGKNYLMKAEASFGEKEAKDIFFAVDYLRSVGRIDPYKIAIWGGGAGASIALKAMDMFPALFRLGIIVYPYTRIKDVIKKSTPTKRAMLNFWSGDKENLGTKKILTPILFFQGNKDTIVDALDSRKFFDNLHHSSESCFTLWEDEAHGLSKDHNKKDYYEKVEAKLKKAFKGGRQFTDFSSEVNLSDSMFKRHLYKSLAALCVVLGIIGSFLPVMPTVVFILMAAIFYSYSSEKSYNKLMNNKLFGSAVRSWYETRCLHTKTKVLAICTIILSFGGSCIFFVKATELRAAMIATALAVCLLLLSLKNFKSLYKD